MTEATQDGCRDFDFLHGTWQVRNRRLLRRLQGCREWEEFAATARCCSALGGLGNVDHFDAILPDGQRFAGMSIRVFDPTTRQWAIWWADDRIHGLTPPVVGAFHDGRGEFRGDDICDGRPVRVRFHWTDITPTSARWSQAFSADDGLSWETNWEMSLTRTLAVEPAAKPKPGPDEHEPQGDKT